jgi:hypothetical protein
MNYNITAYSQLFYQNDMSLVTKNYAGSILQMIEFGSTLTASPYKSKYIILKDNYAECPSYIQSGYDEINEFDNILFNYKNSAYRSIANMFYYTNVFHNWFTHSWNIKDVNRWGYSMVSGYNVYYIKKYEEDFIRVYKYDSINYWPIMGMNLYLTKDITVTFNIEFLYRHTTDQIYQVDYPTSNYGALTFNVIKDGIILITAALPKSRNWRLFNYTYTINGIGNYFITFGQSTLNGRLDLKNISSRIYTDYPDSVEIMGNNLDDNKIMNNIDYFKQSSNKVPDVEKKIRLGVQNLMVNI